jgi:hypothetical protein
MILKEFFEIYNQKKHTFMLLKRFKDFQLNEADEVEFTLDDVETTPAPKAKVESKPEISDEPKKAEEPTEKSEEKPKEAPKSEADEKFEKLKADLKKMIDESGNSADILKRAKDESVESLNIKGLTQESDVYDFYLAHQFEIDEKLNETDFFESSFESRGITGLYNAVIVGTEFAIKKILEEIK